MGDEPSKCALGDGDPVDSCTLIDLVRGDGDPFARGVDDVNKLVRRGVIGAPRGDPLSRGDDAAMEDVRMAEISALARAVRSESIVATLYDKDTERGVCVTDSDPVERGVPV